MKRFILILLFFSFFISSYAGGEQINAVINAIAKVESDNNPKARNGIYVGLLQISPGCLRDCNNILKDKGDTLRFKLSDRYDSEKSKQMFILYQEKYNPDFDIDKAIRIWNGGPGYSVSKTNRYLSKVKSHLKGDEEC